MEGEFLIPFEDLDTIPESFENFENENIENRNEMANNEDIVEKVKKPSTGMLSNSYEELFNYYALYAKKNGFATMKKTSEKGEDGELRYITISCSRPGRQDRNQAIKLGCIQPLRQIAMLRLGQPNAPTKNGELVVVFSNITMI